MAVSPLRRSNSLFAPRWYPASSQRWSVPFALRNWLLDPGSLTAKLMAVSEGDFRVQVLRQTVERATLSERRQLGIGTRRWALVREVLLHVGGEPWVFARSLIPLTSLQGRLRRLRYLDDQPLGGFLFSQPGLDRGRLEVGRVPASQADVQRAAEPWLWGRRSVFRLDNKPLLVSEVFLDPFVRYLEGDRNSGFAIHTDTKRQ